MTEAEDRFRDRMRRLRRLYGITQQELAAKIGVSEWKMSRLETGFTTISLADAIAIAEALDATVDTMAGSETFSAQVR